MKKSIHRFLTACQRVKMQIGLFMSKAYSPNINVYEHGIVIEEGESPASLRLIATTKLPIFSGYSLSIVDFTGRSLNERAIRLVNIKGPYYSAKYYEEHDLKYCVLATLYHLNRLIDLYVGICQLFQGLYPMEKVISGNTSDPRVFYEIDAFLSAARRIYESIRKVLWKHYHGGETSGRWRSIRNVLKTPNNIPAPFAAKLYESLEAFGEKLTDYRDCVAHYDPLTDGHTTCWMEWYENKWAMTVKLPANPDKRSRHAFDFDTGPEALSYCHSVACHLVELCELLEAQTKVALYLDNP